MKKAATAITPAKRKIRNLAEKWPENNPPRKAPSVVADSNAIANGQSTAAALWKTNVAEIDITMMRKRLVVAAVWNSIPKKSWTGVKSTPPPAPRDENTVAMANITR